MNAVHRYALSLAPQEEHKNLNNVLTGKIGTTGQHRVDERGIPMPDWWDDEDTTESIAVQNALAMKSWRGGASA